MFARFGHAAFNTFGFNESRKDADSVHLKDFPVVGPSAKSTSTLTATTKTFGALAQGGGTPYVEVGG